MGACSCCTIDRADIQAANLDLRIDEKVPENSFVVVTQDTERSNRTSHNRKQTHVDYHELDEDCMYNKLSAPERIPSVVPMQDMNSHQQQLEVIGNEYATYPWQNAENLETNWFANQNAQNTPARKPYRKQILNRSQTFSTPATGDESTMSVIRTNSTLFPDDLKQNYSNQCREGQIFWENGNFYLGNWKDNMFHGKGTYTWADGRQYTGEWIRGKMHGKGTYSWPDGSKYEGMYMAGQKNGLGQHYWADGSTYQGLWQDGQQNGLGVFISEYGEKQEGVWEMGKIIEKKKCNN